MIIENNPSETVVDRLLEEVLAVRPADAPEVDRHPKKFAILEKDAAGSLQGGVYVYVHPGWAYVDLLWVDEKCRGKGLASRLMTEAEEEAKRRGCVGVWLWTQEYEAPMFYEKRGYSRFVSFDDFIKGHERIGFMKRLAA